MKYFPFFTFLLLATIGFSQDSFKRIQGLVTDGLDPIQNVNIVVKDTDKGVKTDASGRYDILVDEGQTLVYSYVGKQSVEIIVEDVTKFLNLTLYDNVEELEEVTVTKKKRRTQKELFEEYNENKNLIKTGFGILDKERSGYSIKIIEGKDLSQTGQDFVDGLQSWIPGIQVFRPSSLRPGGGALAGGTRRPTDLTAPIVYLPRASRSTKPVPAAYEVDGIVYTVAPTFLSINNIERIAVIESIAGVARYGSLGVGGMVIINTKTGNFSKKEPGTNKPYDQAKLRNNFYNEEELNTVSTSEGPAYLQKLYEAETQGVAMEVFREQETAYSNNPHFYLDALSFFSDRDYGDKQVKQIARILENRFETDPTILKALAYKLEELGAYRKPNDIYKNVFLLRPHYIQSYLDLARSYRAIDKVENAATLYSRYSYLVENSFFGESETFEQILYKDFSNLLTLEGSVLTSNQGILKNKNEEFSGTRLVFEWNDGEAEFELQFVNPENQYYTWKHSLADNPNRIKDEKMNGFSCEEYLIYEPEKGKWKVNVKYLGNKSLTPTYLKATIYHHFNTSDQTSEIRVFQLREKGVNTEIFSIVNSKQVSVH